MATNQISRVRAERQYCDTCYHAAENAGREVFAVSDLALDLCGLCEQRVRNGLVHYRPSNGSEFGGWHERCFRCRHFIDDSASPMPGRLEAPFQTCAWGVLDRFWIQMAEGYDHIANWFDPADVYPGGVVNNAWCSARCLRFTHKDDRDGALRDPPPRDVPGQMVFGDVDVPTENATDCLSPTDALAGKE